jgi:hypothetical protein
MWYLDRLLRCAITFILAAGAAHRPVHAAPTDPDCGTRPHHSTGSAFAVLAQAAQNSELTPEQRARLKAEVARVPSDLRGRFGVRYRAWKYSLNRPDISLSFNPKVRRKPAEFRALIALGPSTIPLVVDKLTRRDELSALKIYDALQDRPELRVDSPQYPSEEQRALETVKRWLDRPN